MAMIGFSFHGQHETLIMKRLFAFAAAACLLYLGSTFFSPYTLSNKDVEFDIETGTIVRSLSTRSNLIIPNELHGVPVKVIGERAFRWQELKHVVLPDTLLRIEEGAFSLNELSEISLPASLEYIGERAFESNKLVTLVIPSSVRELGKRAFYYNKLSNLDIDLESTHINYDTFSENTVIQLNGETTDGVLTRTVKDGNSSKREVVAYVGSSTHIEIEEGIDAIADYAFAYGRLVKVTLPQSLRHIGESAFCSNQLTEISFGERLETIGADAFSQNRLTTVEIPTWFSEIAPGAFRSNSLRELVIPPSVVTVGDDAFSGNNLSSLQLPDSLRNIGVSAFAMNHLTEVTIPDSVQSVGLIAFYSNKLHTVNMDIHRTKVNGGAFARNHITTLNGEPFDGMFFALDDSGELDNTIIASWAHRRHHVRIPDSVKHIDDQAFVFSGLYSVALPEKLETIGVAAFKNNEISSVVLPSSLTSVGNYAFAYNPIKQVSLEQGTQLQHIGSNGLSDSFNHDVFITLPEPDITGFVAWSVKNEDGEPLGERKAGSMVRFQDLNNEYNAIFE